MNNIVTVRPSSLHGTVQAPPSKSAAHRSIICACLAKGKSVISPISPSDDMTATIQAAQKIGAECVWDGDTLTVDGTHTFENAGNAVIDCIESGSTLRFLIPVCAAGGLNCTFIGRGRLPSRPLGLYKKILPEAGVNCCFEGDGLPLKINGKLQSGKFYVDGNISSQFITGLMLALPLIEGDSEIILNSPLESAGYVDLTVAVMAQYGVKVQKTQNGRLIPGGQVYRAQKSTVEGDWSQAAFYMCASGILKTELTVTGLDPLSTQSDRAALETLRQMGCFCTFNDGTLICRGNELNAADIDASQIPDLVPILAVTAAYARGTTRIYNAARLRLKESDRLACMAQGLTALGVRIEELPDELIIHGGSGLSSGCVKGCNDHRIVMAFTIGALAAKGAVRIDDAQSIKKSYPNFFEEIKRLGGDTDGI